MLPAAPQTPPRPPALQAEFNAPCRTTKYPREIPPLPWYRQTVPQMLMAGFLPFSAIYIELCERPTSPFPRSLHLQGLPGAWSGFRLRAGRPKADPAPAPLPARPVPADYIFASVWGHKVYTIYSILFIVFIILIIVTAFITIALTYFQVRG